LAHIDADRSGIRQRCRVKGCCSITRFGPSWCHFRRRTYPCYSTAAVVCISLVKGRIRVTVHDLRIGYPLESERWITRLVRTLSSDLILHFLTICTVVESLYRPGVPYPVKVLCYAAIADLFEYLPQCKSNPQSILVRQKLQLASWMSLWPLKLEKYRYHLFMPFRVPENLNHAARWDSRTLLVTNSERRTEFRMA
jgi:hypothetical protein